MAVSNVSCKVLSGGNRVQNIPHLPDYPAGFTGYITLSCMNNLRSSGSMPSALMCGPTFGAIRDDEIGYNNSVVASR